MTTPITLPSGSYILVTVPVDAYDFRVINPRPVNKPSLDYNVRSKDYFGTAKLPPGQYELIGLAKEISEDMAATIVEYRGTNDHGVYYRDYGWAENVAIKYEALASLESLLKSNGLELETTVLLKLKT